MWLGPLKKPGKGFTLKGWVRLWPFLRILLPELRNSASSIHWLSSSIFTYCLSFVRPASVTPPLISTIWCFRPYKPYIFWKLLVQGYQKLYSHVPNTQVHQYSIWRSARKTQHVVYFWKEDSVNHPCIVCASSAHHQCIIARCSLLSWAQFTVV